MANKTYNTAYLLDGREWRSDSGGASATARYVVILAEPLDNAHLPTDVSGLPKPGDPHPTFTGLVVKSVRFSEGTGSAKTRLEALVEYGPPEGGAATGAGGEDFYIEKAGWTSGSVQRDLSVDAETGLAVLNSAKQPFESVPQMDRPAPTYVKVFKTKARKVGYIGYVDMVNADDLTVGGYEFERDMVRCVQADEERIFADPDGWKYRYSISLQVISNEVKLEDSQDFTECGWQVPLVDCGTMQISQLSSQSLERITVRTESGQEVPVSSPVLLDGRGVFDPARTTPYVFLVVAYERTTFPAEFTSELP